VLAVVAALGGGDPARVPLAVLARADTVTGAAVADALDDPGVLRRPGVAMRAGLREVLGDMLRLG